MTHDAVDVLDGLLCLLAQIGIRGEEQLLEMAMRYRREEGWQRQSVY